MKAIPCNGQCGSLREACTSIFRSTGMSLERTGMSSLKASHQMAQTKTKDKGRNEGIVKCDSAAKGPMTRVFGVFLLDKGETLLAQTIPCPPDWHFDLPALVTPTERLS